MMSSENITNFVKKCRPTICSIFYQEKEFRNIQSFYALKKLEWQANREHEAAIKIQSFFRKWLMMKNMELLNKAAIKIQSLIRGFLARRRVQRIREELERKRLEDLRNQAATKIQAWWRGYQSRKNNFDFYKYKKLQQKNDEYRSSIDSLNDLESLATMSGSKDEMEDILNRLLNSGNLEDILKLSPSRVCALQSYIDAANKKCLLKGFKPAKKNVELAQQLEERCMKLTQKDSLDDIFPDIPDIPGIIRPDADKVDRLREAIRKLRQNIEMNDQHFLTRHHYLLRTYQQPGVLSEVGTHMLTDKEEKLRSLKFWEEPPPQSPRKLDTCAAPPRTYLIRPSQQKEALSKEQTKYMIRGQPGAQAKIPSESLTSREKFRAFKFWETPPPPAVKKTGGCRLPSVRKKLQKLFRSDNNKTSGSKGSTLPVYMSDFVLSTVGDGGKKIKQK